MGSNAKGTHDTIAGPAKHSTDDDDSEVKTISVKSEVRVANGLLKRCEFRSTCLGSTPTVFAIFIPDICIIKKLPVVYWLSGLTCTDENFSQKACAFQAASDNQVIVVLP